MFGELLRLAGQTLWANRLRSFLTVLGTAVAVLSIVAVVSVIRGADRFVATEVLSTGSDVFTLTKIGMVLDYESFLRARRRPDITLADAEDLERRLRLAEAVVPRESRRVTAKRGRIRAGDVPAWGVGADYPLVGDFEIASGRHLTHLDVVSRSPVAVLGAEIAAHLFPHEDPIGKTVRVGGRRYTVVGVLAARGGTADRSRDEVVLLPITTFEKHFGETSIDILVKARSSAEREAARDEAELALKIRRGLQPWEAANFDVLSDEQLFALYRQATRLLYGALVGIVSLSLLIGGIVIMNIMLVSVTERTREIGIRKAVGARRVHIVSQFLIEAVLLSLGGGAIGVLLGAAVAAIVRAATPVPASVQAWSVLLGLLLACSVGLFFGIYPAHRASRLSPITALRQET